jgi:hypothetical protein
MALLLMGLYCTTNHVDVKNGLPLKRSLQKKFEGKNHINLLFIFFRFGVELLFFSSL